DSLANTFLDCDFGCDTVNVAPHDSFPAYIDYVVSGPIQSGCGNSHYTDTVRVNFVSNLSVTISPENPIICFGDTSATLTATGSGGVAPYNYLWSTGDSTQSIDVDTGAYIVQVTDSLNCSIGYDTVVVGSFALPIEANAGNDTFTCVNSDSIQLY